MLLDKTRAVKIADFGVARVEASNPNDMTGETGTLGYMAPEVSGLMYLITRFWLVLHNHMRDYFSIFWSFFFNVCCHKHYYTLCTCSYAYDTRIA